MCLIQKDRNMMAIDKRLSEHIQEKMYAGHIRRMELLGGKTIDYFRKKANTKILCGRVSWRFNQNG